VDNNIFIGMTPPKVLRVSEKSDIAKAYKIREEVFNNEQGLSIHKDVDDPGAAHHLLWMKVNDDESKENNDDVDNLKAVGTIRLTSPKRQHGKVGRMAVLKEARGNGFDKLLIEAAERTAKEMGLQFMTLDSKSSTVSFYEGLGYAINKEATKEGGDVGIVPMIKPL
jgi:predicted GNAT family N-acyltransferase